MARSDRRRTGTAWPATLGTGGLVLVIVLLGAGAALLAGRATSSPALGPGAAAEVEFSVAPAVWAALFLIPLLVGFVAYLIRLALSPAHAVPMRVGASVAIALVVVLFLLILLPQAPWKASSTVSVGGSGGDIGPGHLGPTGNGTSSGSTPGGGGSGASGSGGGGSGPGGNGSGGSGSGGNGSGSGSGSGAGGSGSGGGGSGAGGSGSGGRGGNGTGGSGGSGSKGGGNCSASGGLPAPGRLAAPPIGIGNCTGGSGGSGGGSGSPGGGPGNNSTAGQSRGAVPARGVTFHLPNWVFLVVALALSAVVGLLAVPGVLSRLFDHRPRRTPVMPVAAVTADLSAALREARLAIENGEVPRESIVRLYGHLLGKVAPYADGLDSATAEEIQRAWLDPLQVPSSRSTTITRLFEEARYSTHPIDRPAADRFATTMREVEDRLAAARAPR